MKSTLGQLATHLAGTSVIDFSEWNGDQGENFLATAEAEGVMLLFLHSLNGEQRSFIDAIFSRQFGLPIGQYIKSHVARELAWLHEIRVLSNALFEAELCSLVFKGGALAYNLYPKSFLRVRCDVDLLFASRAAAERAWGLLQGLGYSRDNAVDGTLVTSEFCAYKPGIGGAILVDIHWNTNNAIHCRSLSFDELYTESGVVDELGAGFRAPCLIHSFVLACHHRIAHRTEGRHNRLIWLYDLHLMLNKFGETEKRQLVDIIERHDIAPVCLDGILASVEYFGTEVEQGWLSLIHQLAANSRNQLSTGQSLLIQDLTAIRRQQGLFNKVLIVKEYAFPSMQYMMKKYGFSSPWVSPFFYLKRAVSGLLKRL